MSDIGSQGGGGGGQKVPVDLHKLMGLIAHMFGGQAQAGQAPGQGMPMPGMVGGQQQSNIAPGTFQTPPGALTGNGPMPQPQQPQPGQPAPGGAASPGTGQQALMSRGFGSPGSTAAGGGGMGGGAMPFMGGAMPQGGMGGGQGGGTYKSYAATPPNLPPPPTIDDALGMVEQVAGAGGFRFGPGSGLDSRGPAIMQALAMLQNQYKEQVGGMLGVFKGNVEQAGDLNQQQTQMAGQRNRSGDEQWGRAMDVARLGQQQRQESDKLGFENKRLGIQVGAEDRRLAFDQSKETREKVDAARKLLADAKDRLDKADKGSEGGWLSKPTPKSDEAKQAEQDIADATAVIRAAGGGDKTDAKPEKKSEDSPSAGGDAAWKSRQIANAKKAIASGVPRDQVIKALQEHGIDHSGTGL